MDRLSVLTYWALEAVQVINYLYLWRSLGGFDFKKLRQFTELPHKKTYITEIPHIKFFITNLPHI